MNYILDESGNPVREPDFDAFWKWYERVGPAGRSVAYDVITEDVPQRERVTMINLQPGDVVLVLRPLKDPDGLTVEKRLASVMKHAKRYCYLNCVWFEVKEEGKTDERDDQQHCD